MAFPATYNFNYYAGDTFEFLIYPKDSNGGIFTDLEQYTARFSIAPTRSSSPVLDSVGDPQKLVAEISDTGEYISCEIKAQYGAELTGSSYVYDVQIQYSEKVYTLVTGTISVLKDISG
jgi:hypothetical protein